MNQDDLSQISALIEKAIDDRERYNQYNLSPISFHVHTGTDSPQIDYNTLLNKPTTKADLVYSTSGNSAFSLIVPVDLDTDGGFYKIYVSLDNLVSSDKAAIRLNGSSANDYYGAVYHWSTGGAATNPGDKITINAASNDPRHIQFEALMTHKPSNTTFLFINSTGAGPGVALVPDTQMGSWQYNSTTNITQIEFFTVSGTSYSWNIRIYKLPT